MSRPGGAVILELGRAWNRVGFLKQLSRKGLPSGVLTAGSVLTVTFDQLRRESAGCAASSAQMAFRPAEQFTVNLSHDLQCGGGELCSWAFLARASRKCL